MIPLSSPDIGDLEIERVAKVLRSGQLSLGPVLARFEEQFAAALGTKYAVAASSGTSALHMCVKAMGLRQGMEVLTTSFSFVASVNCLLYEKVYPRLIDIDPVTLNIDAERIHRFLRTKCRRDIHGRLVDSENGLEVKAILPVHVFGLPADMNAILDIAAEYDLEVLEDSCEALGAEYGSRLAGTMGRAGVFGFYPNKQITTGEGGMIVTDDAVVAEKCRSLRNQGRDADGQWLKHVSLGFNYRMSDIQAAIGLAQLERLPELLSKRAEAADLYKQALSDIPFLRLPCETSNAKRSWFVFVVQISTSDGRQTRDALRQNLLSAGIATQTYFPAIHKQPYFREFLGDPFDLPVTEHASDTCLALPFSTRLSETEIRFVADAVRAHYPNIVSRPEEAVGVAESAPE
ncbi:MAG TPA: DegT/DnrJ/EryC1/StrS family aminotransferase [Terriglobales bacterium]|nr:DegT/DnrJ/EryC1/StrS family aminotransferase [Terriglobales bacterium]